MYKLSFLFFILYLLAHLLVPSYTLANHHSWHEDFENLSIGTIDGQEGWSVIGLGSILNISEVVNTESRSGEKSLLIKDFDSRSRRQILYSPNEDLTNQKMTLWFRKNNTTSLSENTEIGLRSFVYTTANVCHFTLSEDQILLDNGASASYNRSKLIGTYLKDTWTQLDFKITETTCEASLNGEPLQSIDRLGQPASEKPFHLFISSGDPEFYIDDIAPIESSEPLEKETQLAERHTPILYFHESEKYRPQEIKVVLETGDLLKDGVLQKPSPLQESDLASNTEPSYTVDLDGDVLIEKSPISNEAYKNTTYVHIANDQSRVVLQYWFFYYFNDWQGAPLGSDFTHEGDWEMIQLTFPQDKSVQEIVDQNLSPEQAIYSAHLGGYEQIWSDVEKEITHPIVYVAQGSHANHFEPGVCDLESAIAITPGSIDKASKNNLFYPESSLPIIDPLENTQFAWLLFAGQWGENFNSPESPPIQTDMEKWDSPISWANSAAIEWNSFYADRCDGDFDGIWNNADTQPTIFSSAFSSPGPFGSSTEGTITKRGNREFKIKDAQIGGTHFEVGPGTETAIIKLTGAFCVPQSTITFKPSSTKTFGTATCLSSEISIAEGSAEFSASHNGVQIITTVGPNQTVHYDIVNDQLQIETSGEGQIPITVNGYSLTIQAGQTTSIVEVLIDIKPNSYTNPINCTASNSIIPVAVLTTETFSAAAVNHATVSFEGANEFHQERHEEDVNNDSNADLVFHFRLVDTDLACGATKGTLLGQTFSGDIFIGADLIDTKDK